MESPTSLLRTPRQGNLFARRGDSRPMRATAVDQYAAGNRQAAQIIVESPAKYGGLMGEWAQRTLQAQTRPEGLKTPQPQSETSGEEGLI